MTSGKRKCDVIMDCMRSGFIGLSSYQYMFGLATSPDCFYCPGTRETIQHYLLYCPRQVLPRDKLFRRLNSIGITDDIITVSLLLSGSDFSPGIRRKIFLFLFDYFKDTDKIDQL